MDATIELIHFEGCPNVEATRKNLVEALGTLGLGEEWREWDLEDSDTPDRVRGYGSPTVLVNGVDVSGAEGGTVGLACRADGAPSVDAIVQALGAHR